MEQELDLYKIWQIVTKRWKLLVLIPLLAALASLLVSLFLITPQYRATTTLMVTRPAETTEMIYRDIQLSRELIGTYREIIHSRQVQELVIAARSLPYSVSELRGKTEVEAVRDTELIKVDVTDPDPQLASDIANDTVRIFMEQIVEIMKIENVSIIDEAVTPGGPVSPRVEMNVAVALVVGLMGAVGLSFLLEYLDRTVKDAAEIQEKLDLPLIGSIPISTEGQLFTYNNPRSPATEAFRTLRTNIQYASVDRPMKKILVTGANPACGKSTLSSNLALTIAQTGASVLLIDGDLRRPTQHKIFGVSSDPGLSSLVVKKSYDLNGVVRLTEHERLSVLPSGQIPPYPAELLGSERMKELVNFLETKYDFLIFDSPPVIAVTDASLISKLVDGTLLVLDHGRVRKEEAAEANEQLRKVGAHVIGLVLNGIPTGKGYYYYHYSEYYESNESDSRRGRKKKKAASN